MTPYDYRVIVTQVESHAYLENTNLAVKAIKAFLETLGEWLSASTAASFAAHLPREFRIYLFRDPEVVLSDSSLEEFLRRVGERENFDPLTAFFHSRAIVQIFSDHIPSSQMEEVREALPDNFRVLFEETGESKEARVYLFSDITKN